MLSMLLASCGSDEGGSSNSAEDGNPNIRTSERIYTIADLKAAGGKANKDYDVAELPGAESAWRVIFNRLDYEARFYPDHQTALDEGVEYADHVTGEDAVVTGEDVIWSEGAKDRRRCSRSEHTPHSGCSYSSRYWDFVVLGNMILMCEGLEGPESIKNCDELIAKIP